MKNLILKRIVILELVGAMSFSMLPSQALVSKAQETQIEATTPVDATEVENSAKLDAKSQAAEETILGTKDTEETVAITPIDADEQGKLQTEYIDMSDYIVQAGGFKDISDFLQDRGESLKLNGAGEDSLLEINGNSALQNEIYSALLNFKESLDVSSYNISSDDIGTEFYTVLALHPRLFYVKSGYGVSYYTEDSVNRISFSYIYSASVAKAKLVKYDEAIEEFMDGVQDDWCDYEKVIYINTYMCQHCVYDMPTCEGHPSNNDTYDAYGCLVENLCVCQGYAEAFMELATQLGLTAAMVTSYDINHAWNLVKVNGNVYHIDTTWDDSGYTVSDHVGWTYFLQSTAKFKTSHVNSSCDWKARGNGLTYQSATETKYDTASDALSDSYLYSGLHPAAKHLWYGVTYDSSEPTDVLNCYTCDCVNGTISKKEEIKQLGKFKINSSTYLMCGATIVDFLDYAYISTTDTIYKLDKTTGLVTTYYTLSEDEKANGVIRIQIVSNDSLILYLYTYDTYGHAASSTNLTIELAQPGSHLINENYYYQVTLNENYGDFPTTTDLYLDFGEQYSSLRNSAETNVGLITPSRKYYTFAGWNTSADGTGKTVTSSSKFKKIDDITLYAQWTPIYYTASFDVNGGTLPSSGNVPTTKIKNISNIKGDNQISTTAFSEPTKKGYDFAGWYTDATDGVKVVYTDTMAGLGIITNFTLYAHYTPKTYTVTLDKNADDATISNTTATVYYDSTYGDLVTPKRTGYTFAGWYTSPTKGTLISPTTKVAVTADQTLYAHWTENTYTLRLHSNLAKDTVKTYKHKYTDTYTLPTFASLKISDTDYYTLKIDEESQKALWNTSSLGNGTNYLDGQEVSKLSSTPNGTVDLYAIYEDSLTYTVKILKGDETASDGIYTDGQTLTLNYRDVLNLSGNEFTRLGYTLTGYKLVSESTQNPITRSATLKLGDLTGLSKNNGEVLDLTAVWKQNTYKVSYAMNKGTYVKGAAKGTSSYNIGTDETKLVLPTAQSLVRKGYIFGGWFTDSAFTAGNQVTSLKITGTTPLSRTLYAKWTPITYTVNLDAAGGSDGTMTAGTTTVNYDENILLKKDGFTQNGYTLSGFKTRVNNKDKSLKFGNIKNLTDQAEDTVTITAVWKPVTYSITYVLDGGKQTKAPTKYSQANISALTLSIPSKAGYTFKGWTVALKDNTKPGSAALDETDASGLKLASSCYGNLVLTAEWTENSYTITVTSADKDTSLTKTVKYTDLVDLSALAVEYETKCKSASENSDNKSVISFTDSKGKKYAVGKSISKLSAEDSVSLTAVWGTKINHITYELNGGTIKNAPATYVTGKVPTIPTPTKTGYHFLRWENSTGSAISISNTSSTDVTLYASYEANDYSIVFKKNASDAVGNDVNMNATYDIEVKYPEFFSRPGYTLLGYSTKSNSKTGATTLKNISTKNGGKVTLYAIWSANKYTVTCSSTTPAYSSVLTTTYGKALTPKAPTVTGYTFKGWTLDSESESASVSYKKNTVYVTSVNKNNKVDLGLKANWTENVYTLKINSNGGVNAATLKAETAVYQSTSSLINYTANVDLSSYMSRFVKTGYILKGFATDKKGKNIVATSSAATVSRLCAKNKGTATLYAIWEKVDATAPSITVTGNTGSFTVVSSASQTAIISGCQIKYQTSAGSTQSIEESKTSANVTVAAGKYYVRLRLLKKDSAGNTVYTAWSQVYSVTVN